jgi:hypothetical protein
LKHAARQLPSWLISDVRRSESARLTTNETSTKFTVMSILELKQRVSRLSQRERQELQLYLLRLKRETPAWKRATAKKIRDMQGGKFTTLEELATRVGKK